MAPSHQMLMWDIVSPILGVFIVIVNLIQIASILQTKRNKLSIPFIFILNLSISDLLVGLTEMLIKTMYWVARNYKVSSQIFSDVFQYVIFVFLRMSLLMSMLNLIAITFDRLFCVVKPIRYRRANRKNAIFVCITLWIISLISSSLYYYGMSYLTDKYTNWRLDLLIFPMVTLPTLPILSSVYVFIWFHVKKKNKALQETDKSLSKTFEKRRKQEHGLFALACAVVLIFLICWLPISIYSLLKIFEADMRYDFDNIMFVIAMSNSLLNPLLYFHFIRSMLWKVLKRAIQRPFVSKQQQCCETVEFSTRRDISTTTLTASMADSVC